MPLTDMACRTAKAGPTRKKLCDGDGLQLWVQPNGSRLWQMAYRFNGKQRQMALGPYPDVSLAEARDKRYSIRRLLRDGIDPAEQKKKAVEEAKPLPGDTFKDVAQEFMAKCRREQLAERTLEKKEWILSLAYPGLGPKRVGEIKPIDVLRVLQEVESRGCYETARRMRSTIGAVCRFAVATARAETDPTNALRGALTTPRVTPRAAITDPKGFGGLLRAIDGFEGEPTTLYGLKLMALLFPRPRGTAPRRMVGDRRQEISLDDPCPEDQDAAGTPCLPGAANDRRS